MFLAPVLYALHAVATGLAMVLMNAFGVHLGFSFSAGLFDYVLNFTHAQRPLLLIPIGVAYFALYYAVFRVCIVRLNLSTPGREADDVFHASAPSMRETRGTCFVDALGGAANLTEVTACTTRLRLSLIDNRAIDEPALTRLGSRGLLRSAKTGLQVVLGPIADQVAGEIRAAMRPGAPRQDAVRDARGVPDAPALLAALGGRGNVADIECHAGRVLVRIADPKVVDEPALRTLGIRGVAHPAGGFMQLLIPGPAEDWAQPLRRLLA
jgi:PTS system N-acetylglucosamine-specific IIC component